MRPGAAVRLKGTWVDESGKKAFIDGSAQASDTKGESETSTSPEQPELKVSEVEILGGSDPMVRVPILFQHIRTFLSHRPRHTRFRTNIRLLKAFERSPIFDRERPSTPLCYACDRMPPPCSHSSFSVSGSNRRIPL
jgi:hypothetical protein